MEKASRRFDEDGKKRAKEIKKVCTEVQSMLYVEVRKRGCK